MKKRRSVVVREQNSEEMELQKDWKEASKERRKRRLKRKKKKKGVSVVCMFP